MYDGKNQNSSCLGEGELPGVAWFCLGRNMRELLKLMLIWNIFLHIILSLHKENVNCGLLEVI